jgi:Co/Zn/Cd efflux system component
MLVEVVGGVISGSLALLADAGHMVSDAAALGMSWAALHFGKRPADSMRSYRRGDHAQNGKLRTHSKCLKHTQSVA